MVRIDNHHAITVLNSVKYHFGSEGSKGQAGSARDGGLASALLWLHGY